MSYEGKVSVETVVLIAILTAIASVGRMVPAFIPQVQLVSFVIIMSGIFLVREWA
ncbi:MAG: hypothetical protein LBC39_05755 [Methanobrevibacter sp.]|jgi:energy-coupling factor transport system substrate-specific component|nr:hypothetical protein [Candidatus Methanovirga aequatorialis]